VYTNGDGDGAISSLVAEDQDASLEGELGGGKGESSRQKLLQAPYVPLALRHRHLQVRVELVVGWRWHAAAVLGSDIDDSVKELPALGPVPCLPTADRNRTSAPRHLSYPRIRRGHLFSPSSLSSLFSSSSAVAGAMAVCCRLRALGMVVGTCDHVLHKCSKACCTCVGRRRQEGGVVLPKESGGEALAMGKDGPVLLIVCTSLQIGVATAALTVHGLRGAHTHEWRKRQTLWVLPEVR
jgi:hypothetical protein